MLAVGFATFGDDLWTTWVPLGAGVVVTSLVLGFAVMYGRWRRRLTDPSREEDLPWDSLLELLHQRNRDRAATGLPPEQLTEELLGQLVARLPAVPDARPLESPEDREFQLLGGTEQRAGGRRWGNPTEVYLYLSFSADRVHGLLVNRSTGGVGIYLDQEVQPGTILQVRAADAPSDIPTVRVEVRHCRKVSKGFVVGCQFCQGVPWNVRVWLG
jgi:hypothetical protein